MEKGYPSNKNYNLFHNINNFSFRGANIRTMMDDLVERVHYDPSLKKSYLAIFIGTNGYEHNNPDDYLNFIEDLIEACHGIVRLGFSKENLLIMSPLPRGEGKQKRNKQVGLLRTLHYRLKKHKFPVLNTFNKLPKGLRDDPSYLYGIEDQKKKKYVHYSTEVRKLYHHALGDYLPNFLTDEQKGGQIY